MRRLTTIPTIIFLGTTIFVAGTFFNSSILAQTDTTKPIGNYIISKGTVTATHLGESTSTPVKIRDGVLFQDVITTSANSKTKALFVDDSILTLGENSSVAITEHVFSPNTNTRSTIIKLIKGKLRVLVGKTFLGLGSRFEIHTNTASVAARGTYMVIWIEPEAKGNAMPASYVAQAMPTEGGTGVALLNGTATFATPQGSITVPAGQFSFAAPGASPSMPMVFANAPFVQRHIAATAVLSESSPAQISSVETLSHQGQDNSLLVDPLKASTPSPSPSPDQTTKAAADDGNAGGGSARSSGTTPTPTAPNTTSPMVITTVTPTVPIAPIVPVEIQMEPAMARTEAAMMGGRELPILPKQPTGTLTIEGPKLP